MMQHPLHLVRSITLLIALISFNNAIAGDNHTCVKQKLYEITPGTCLFYADYLEGGCEAEEQAVYVEADCALGDTPDQECEHPERPCFVSSRRLRHASSDGLTRIPHHTPHVFAGFRKSLPADYQPRWASGVSQSNVSSKRIKLAKEGRI
jgi:hypothetical protein